MVKLVNTILELNVNDIILFKVNDILIPHVIQSIDYNKENITIKEGKIEFQKGMLYILKTDEEEKEEIRIKC